MSFFPLFAKLDEYFNANILAESGRGEVYIVGAGPGDLGLLTIKALHLIQQADVVFYDYLVSTEILDTANKKAKKIAVGKRAGNHSVPQKQINQLLVDYALQGKKVCRLKGGDPFIFGRGGEEVQTLVANQIPFQIVPGVTAASGCSAYAGIPLTHRDYAQTVQFVTGHLKKDGSELNWQSLAEKNQTLVIYMGKMRSAHISQQLMNYGRDASTPVAIIENGTLSEQRVVLGKLSELADLVEDNQIGSPALMVIGEVVALASELSWFNAKASFEQHKVAG